MLSVSAWDVSSFSCEKAVHIRLSVGSSYQARLHCRLNTRGLSPRQVPRFMTKTCLLDYDSIAGADKFGNIFVLRVPTDVSDDVDNPTGVSSANNSSRSL